MHSPLIGRMRSRATSRATLTRRHTSLAASISWTKSRATAPGRFRKIRLALKYILLLTTAGVFGLFILVRLTDADDAGDFEPARAPEQEHLLNTLSRTRRLPPHLRRQTRPDQPSLWSGRPPPDEGIDQTYLPAPFDNYRFTFLHASVREQRETYQTDLFGNRFLQVLAFVEKTPPRRSNEWQIFVPDLEPNIVTKLKCSYPGLATHWTGTGGMRYRFPEHPWALFLHCPLPPNLPTFPTATASAVPVTITLELTRGRAFTYSFDLKRTILGTQSQVGICVAPVYGKRQESKLLEWRLHHWLLGFTTVHWYDRTDGPALKDWVRKFNAVTGATDTWGAAPPISPETYGKDTLKAEGMSADQVVYYMDCVARARTTNPSDWLAFTDLDEYHVPDPFPSTQERSTAPSIAAKVAVRSFYWSQPDYAGSVCITRTVPFGPHLPHPPAFWNPTGEYDPEPLQLAMIASQRPPMSTDLRDNQKCVHRSNALESTFVHWPTSYYPYPGSDASAYNTTVLKTERPGSEPAWMRILHFSDHHRQADYSTAYPITEGLVKYLGELNEARQTISAAMDWPCATVPCR